MHITFTMENPLLVRITPRRLVQQTLWIQCCKFDILNIKYCENSYTTNLNILVHKIIRNKKNTYKLIPSFKKMFFKIIYRISDLVTLITV